MKKILPVPKKIRQNIASLKNHIDKTKLLFSKKKKNREIDSWVYNCENLPKFGKEFWFMHFASTDKDSKGQLILTFGQSEGKVRVNQMTIDPKENKKTVAAVCWAYQDEKIDILNSAASLIVSPGSLTLKGRDSEIIFSKSYPKYSLCVKSRGKVVAKFDMSEVKTKQKKYEFSELYRTVFGFELVNIYLNFKGTLAGRKIKGRALVQKVLATTPFIPWRWGRFTFGNGSTLELYKLCLGPNKLSYKIASNFRFSDVNNGEHAALQDLAFEQVPNMPFWSVQSKDKKLKMIFEVYSSEEFNLKTRGNFDYFEHLANIVYFHLEKDGKVITLNDLGGGIGMFEVTKGCMI